MEEYSYLGVIEDMIRDRQYVLLDTICKLYEINTNDYIQIRKWITQGCIAEKSASIRPNIKNPNPNNATNM